MGSSWPAKLRQALSVSRCVVAVWSPEYFRSAWCQAEWQTILERERTLGWRSEQEPRRINLPCNHADGEHFPAEAKNTQAKDLRAWNYGAPIFRDTAGYLVFDKEVQKLSNELGAMIRSAPALQDWPVVTPTPPSSAARGTTFYSYKGGVGRRLALANVGALLCRWGFKVLCIDWDLEAPGLHLYYEKWMQDAGRPGLTELMNAFATGERPDWREFLLDIRFDVLMLGGPL